MHPNIIAIDVPILSNIGKQLHRADFFDSYEMPLEHKGRSALEIYLQVIAKTPAWVNFLMAARNRIVMLFDLKNLGHLGDVHRSRVASDYRVGDRVGIFTLLFVSDDEVILGDSDKHLDVKVSIFKFGNSTHDAVAVSTVVHIHNVLGRVYMFFVAPIHKLIVPATLARAYIKNTNA